jgi:hypothetical protein
MRTLTLFLTLLFLSLIGCKPYSYFKTPNDVLKSDCTVFLTDGTAKKGKLTIQFETGHRTDNMIHLMSERNREEKISIDNIQYYQINNDCYYPKKINLETYEIPSKDNLYLPDVRNILFMKRLTKENSKIILYELSESRINSLDGLEHQYYFISFQSDDRLSASNIGSNKFFPKFEEKMSNLVSDCPLLSNKIRQKTKGYFASQISLDLKKYEIFKKIIEEYNTCN